MLGKDSLKKIGMVLKGKFPTDIRVEKEALSLVKVGYSVYLLCNIEPNKPSFENWRGINICRALHPRHRFDTLAFLLFFKHPIFMNSINVFVNKWNIDVLHIHDLPLGLSGVKIARKNNIPVVLDLHENYPGAVEAWRQYNSGLKHLIVSFFSTRRRWLKEEKKAVRAADQVIVVVDEMKETLGKRAGITSDKIHVITNTESIAFLDQRKENRSLVDKFSKFTLLYSGGFGPHRGIDTVIRSMATIKKKIPHIRLVLVGTGEPHVVEHFTRLAKSLGVENLIDWEGWQPFEQMVSYMMKCDVGIIPHNFNEHTDNTVPHKLFQHMMVGMPIIVSSCRPLARIANETQAGLVFQANDPLSFAETTIKLFEDDQLYKKMCAAGQLSTIKGHYLWEKTALNLIALYEKFSQIR